MRLIRICVALAAIGLGACRGDGSSEPVVATTPVVADLAREVAGDELEIRRILAPNADPHEYEPRPSDAAAIGEADVVLRSGGDLDDWMAELIDASGSDATVTSLIASTAEIEGDPHWWHDPANVVEATRAIRDALSEADPDGQEAYARNAARYEEEVQALDVRIRKCMDAIPAAQRKLVTTHDSLGYFARRYGIEVIGSVIPSLSTEAQPSAGDTADLIEQIKREEVKVVFSESSVNSKVENAIAREAGASVGDELWADTLGPADSDGATYLEAMASNADALARGFTGGRGC